MFQACRPLGRLFYWVLGVVWASGAAWAAPQGGPALTSVVDTVYAAGGNAAQGVLVITWPAFVTGSGTAVAAGVLNVTLGTNGALNVGLVPNAAAIPAGVYYTVVYQLGPGEVRTEYWVVPTTTPATLAQVRTTPGAGTAVPGASVQYVNSALAGKANDNAVVHLAGTETVTGDKSGEEKKDAAMSFLQNALAMTDAVAAREIIDPAGFRQGISKVIDGTVQCLNASTWCKQPPPLIMPPAA